MDEKFAAGVKEQSRRGAGLAVSFLLGLAGAPLPARWRRLLPFLAKADVAAASVPAALLQVVAGLAAFAWGYAAWLQSQYRLIDAAAAAKGHGGTWDVGENEILGRALLSGNPMLPFVFAFTSPLGFALGVAAAGGLVRLLHGVITHEVMPDPVLGLADWAWSAWRREKAGRDREASKDRSPDRLILGGPGHPFSLRLESAEDLDWNPLNTVRVGQDLHRVLARSEVRTPHGLRLRYDLGPMPVGEPIRGAVRVYSPSRPPVIASADEAEPGPAPSRESARPG